MNLVDVDILITNHKMLALHLQHGFLAKDGAFTSIIIDEAHDFESTLMDTIGCKITPGRIKWARGRIDKAAIGKNNLPVLASQLQQLLDKFKQPTVLEQGKMGTQYVIDLLKRLEGELKNINLDPASDRYESVSSIRS